MEHSIADMISGMPRVPGVRNLKKKKSESVRDGNIDWIFPTPLYTSLVDNYDAIQSELYEALNKSQFEINPHWGHTHYLSDITFQENFLVKRKCHFLLKELDFHIKKFGESTMPPEKFKMLDYRLTTSWAALFKTGNYAHIHHHGRDDVSGVYYYQTSGDDGSLFFEGSSGQAEERAEIKPKQGSVVIFPSWLRHGVYTNLKNEDRVSISFNIQFGVNYVE